jgi:hypothetical protein
MQNRQRKLRHCRSWNRQRKLSHQFIYIYIYIHIFSLGCLHVWCVFMPKCVLCSEIVIRCRNCVGCSEFVIRCRNWVFCSELAFAAELCVVQRNCDSLPKLRRLQRISIHCQNWVVCSEFVIRCQNWVFCSELAFAAELCSVQRNCDSLPKLCRLQRISIRSRIVCCATN